MRRLTAIYACELVVLGFLIIAAVSYRSIVSYDPATALAEARSQCHRVGDGWAQPHDLSSVASLDECATMHRQSAEAFTYETREKSSLIWAAGVVTAVLAVWTRG